MKSRTRSITLLSILAVFAACASTEVTQQAPTVRETISRPNQIWVFDFAPKPNEIATDPFSRAAESIPGTEAQMVSSRPLGALIARGLVTNINEMGFSAVEAGPESAPQVGDSEIRGYLSSADDGVLARRFIIGFGAGRSEMNTVAEYYQVTAQGLRKLGSWALSSSGSETPGILVPVATAIALGNPLHLLFSTAMKIYGEESGRSKLEGRAKATADALAGQLRIAFQDWGWIS
jgi:hypothetical protein